MLKPKKPQLTGSAEDNKEVHAIDTNAWIVSDAQIDVLIDAEAEVAGLREVLSLQLVFLDLQALLEDLLGLFAANGGKARDLLVSSNTERSNGVSG